MQGATQILSEEHEGIRRVLALIAKAQEKIDKEDNILYPMGNEVLTAQDQEYLRKEFDKVEEEKIGPGKHEAYHQMIEKWEKNL